MDNRTASSPKMMAVVAEIIAGHIFLALHERARIMVRYMYLDLIFPIHYPTDLISNLSHGQGL